MASSFACYFPAEEPFFFSIEVKSNAWVSDILKAIRSELRDLYRLDLCQEDLHLFKTDVSLESREDRKLRARRWLHQQRPDSHLDTGKNLSSVFPMALAQPTTRSILSLLIQRVYFTVFFSPILTPDILAVLQYLDTVNDPDDEYNKRVRKDLNERINRLDSCFSPSDTIVSPSKLALLFGGDNAHIHLDRVPAVIFNSVLAALQRDLDNLERVHVSRADVNRASSYLDLAVMPHLNKDTYRKLIRNVVDSAVGASGEWVKTLDWADGISPDASWWHNDFLIQALELKNTLGLSGDAIIQAIIAYSKVISQKKYKAFRDFCNFPVVLVGITANRLQIYIAVCVGSIYASNLLSLDLSSGFHDSTNVVRLARVFAAFLSCCEELKGYYDAVATSAALISHRLSCLYPSPTLADPARTLPKLMYHKLISRDGRPIPAVADLGFAITAMYTATLIETGQEIIVKFTARYNEKAHRLLADAQLAPALLFCDRVVGGLYMVVMERVGGSSIWELREDKVQIPAIVAEKVEEAVCRLHAEEIVFGDLRDPNILYIPSNDSSDERVLLVDFDWPGKDGESKYPATLNPANTWADDVSAYGVMRKAHDIWQVNRLKVLCTQDA